MSFLCIKIFTDVYLSLNDVVIPNHGYVLISDIGLTNKTALLCNTNLAPSDDQMYYEGSWFTPDKTKVHEEGAQGFLSNRDASVVRLKKKNSTDDLQQGLYFCEINDTSTDTTFSVYVGLYQGAEGLYIIVLISYIILVPFRSSQYVCWYDF